MNQGTRFEGTAMLRDFRIAILKLPAIIGHQAVGFDPDDTEQMSMRALWRTDTDRARRVALALHAGGNGVHYGVDNGRSAGRGGNPRQNACCRCCRAMLLYLVFFPAANLD